MTTWSEVVEVILFRTDQLTSLSLGLATSSSAVWSHDCAQLSAPKEHHSTCQHLSPPNTSSPTWLYNSAVKLLHQQPQRGNPRGDECYWNAASPSPSITIRKKVPSDCFALPATLLLLLSFNVGTHPDTNEDWLLSFFCRCGVFFFPPLS